MEFADEADVVDALVAEVRRVVVEPEGRMVLECRERALGAGDVEGDFRRVDFQRRS